MYALCYASGLITFSTILDPTMNTLPILKGPKKAVEDAIAGAARLAYDNETWLVPGIPELRDEYGDIDQMKAMDALHAWVDFHRKHWKKLGLKVYG